MGGMKALVKTQAGPGLELMDVPMPEVGPNDVLIKIHKTAICGTDLHIWNWDKWAQQTIPVGMHVGHEFCGVIESVGSSVTEYKPGEIVSGEGHIVCGHCRSCRSGQKHLCPNTKGVGVNRPGCFAEYLSIPQDNVVRIHKSIPMEIASIFDPLGNAVHTALSWDLVGEDVLITGAGVIGCMAAAVCKKAGAKTVVITDINDFRLGLAKTLGADRTVNVTREKLENVLERAMERLGARGNALILSWCGSVIRLSLDEIRYLEVMKNYVTVHAGEVYSVKGTLQELERELDESFYKVHRSYIVNLRFVKKVTKTAVTLKEGQEIPLSRKAYEGLNRALIRYF